MYLGLGSGYPYIKICQCFLIHVKVVLGSVILLQFKIPIDSAQFKWQNDVEAINIAEMVLKENSKCR